MPGARTSPWVDASTMAAVAVVAMLGVACGTLPGGNGGGDNLPNRRIVPFDRLGSELDMGADTDADVGAPPDLGSNGLEPGFVLADDERDLTDPFPIALDGEIALYFTSWLEGDASIWRADSSDGIDFDEPVEVLLPETIWEGRTVTGPSLVQTDDGSLLLFYLAGERGGRLGTVVGVARSTDGGLTFDKESAPKVFPEENERWADPSAVLVDGRFLLFVAITDGSDENDPPLTQIVRFNSTDADRWTRAGVVLDIETGCTDLDDEPVTCWDEAFVRSPGVRYTRSPAGRNQIDIWYTGGMGNGSAIGFAGSYDGTNFTRYRLNPIVDDEGSEANAAVIEHDGTLLMYFSDRTENGNDGIGLALQPPR